MKKIEKVFYEADDGVVFEPWTWREGGWIYQDDLGIWMRYDGSIGMRSQWDYCMGDRYIHASYGESARSYFWHGSYYFVKDRKADMDWHGGMQTHEVCKAIRWVQSAGYKEFGKDLWGV